MILLATALAMTAADLDALDSAVQRCDREAVNPIFAGVAASRSLFTTETYREQEAIVAERLDISNRKRALREASGAALKGFQEENDALMGAATLKAAYRVDVEPILAMARLEAGAAIDPVGANRASNYRAKVAAERPEVSGAGGGIV